MMCLVKSQFGIKTIKKQLVILLEFLTEELQLPKHIMNICLIVHLLFMVYNEITYFFKNQNNAS